jgi:UDP-glucose 4-epimerase
MLEHLNAKPETPQRVVILGAGGFVGSAIARTLQSQDVPILPVTRKELNLLSEDAPAKLGTILKPTDHLVVVSAVAPAKTVAMLMQNLRMIEAVCSALSEIQVSHLVYVSSDAVYADDANPVNEESPCAPSTIHGMMHAARELMLRSSTRAPLAVLRPTLIYGTGDPHNGYGPNRFCREAAQGGPVQIFGDGEEQRDHISIDDVASIVSQVLIHRSLGVLNLVTGVSTSFRDIAQMIASRSGVEVKSQPRQGPRPHLQHRFFDITHRLKVFPTFRPMPLAEGLTQMSRGVSGRS